MKPPSVRLEGGCEISTVCRFLAGTPDGLVAIVLMLGYIAVFLGVASGIVQIPYGDLSKAEWLIATAFMPVLLFVVFVRHRAGTELRDNVPVPYSIFGLLVVAAAPIVIITTT